MGPFGEGIYRLVFFICGDAMALVPWLLVVTGFRVISPSKGLPAPYIPLLVGFSITFLALTESFFSSQLLNLHGHIPFSLMGTLVDGGELFFGRFGLRFLLGIATVICGALFFNGSIQGIVQPIRAVVHRGISVETIIRWLFYKKNAPAPRPEKAIHLAPKRAPILKHMVEAKPTSAATSATPVAIMNPPVSENALVDPPRSIADLDTGGYVLPPVTLLKKPQVIDPRTLESDMRTKADILEMALASFNVEAKVVNITIGPSVSRFELQPGDGVKIVKITNLAQDIALKLSVPSVRIEAPIPGKALIGIEVPNADVAALTLRSIIDPATFLMDGRPLACALGQRITGEPVVMDLSKMPHILVAGSTGSGKSVCVNAIILSILMKASPQDVKFLMIDPKKVELSLYADIPHLLAPVVTNPHKAAATLKQWALVEMERRYDVFTQHGVKDLAGFNQLARSQGQPDMAPMPYIVVIIDEFADLMMVAAQDVENTVCRLAQMARATGIHLVIATQRPSVNVVTGLIKANIPSRISFAVQSQIDSRTVLDMGGAEKLLGRGDMLYLPVGASKPDRLQGVFVSEDEVNAVVRFIKDQAAPDYNHEVMDVDPDAIMNPDEPDLSDRDALFDQAKIMVQSTQYASTSYLQRKLRIGYNRAARLMDELEAAGVISSYDSDTKTRTVLSDGGDEAVW